MSFLTRLPSVIVSVNILVNVVGNKTSSEHSLTTLDAIVQKPVQLSDVGLPGDTVYRYRARNVLLVY